MSKFEIGGDTSTTQSPVSYNDYSDSDDEDTLPYPAELPRNDFLVPDFQPQTYLSTLRNRHQTLEDLRSDLRQRSQLLNQELVDLVNNNYEEFLRLGADLKGGEEEVEGVRVGLLGYERDLEGIRQSVTEQRKEVGGLLEERQNVRRQVVLGRALLELDSSIQELEASLKIAGCGGSDVDEDWSDTEGNEGDDDGENNDTATGVALEKHQRHTEQFILLTRLMERIGRSHPFVQNQKPRIDGLRKTLLLDLRASLAQAKDTKLQDLTLAILHLYATLDAQAEGVRALRGS